MEGSKSIFEKKYVESGMHACMQFFSKRPRKNPVVWYSLSQDSSPASLGHRYTAPPFACVKQGLVQRSRT